MISPLSEPLSQYRLNKTLHGRSRYRPADVPGHNCFVWRYGSARADAGDLFCKPLTPVVAMHDGDVVRVIPKLGCIQIENEWALTVYAHLNLTPGLAVGDNVRAGDKLGYVSATLVKDPHLHLECYVQTPAGLKAISGRRPKEWLAGVVKRIERT